MTYTPPPEHRETASRGTLWDMHYLDDIRHDPWGTAMEHAGALADVLAVRGDWDAIPAGLDYRPPIMGAHVEGYAGEWYREEMDAGHISPRQASHALAVLDRYLDFVRLAGRDY